MPWPGSRLQANCTMYSLGGQAEEENMNIALLCIQPFVRFYSVVVITRDSDYSSPSRNPGSNPGRTSFS